MYETLELERRGARGDHPPRRGPSALNAWNDQLGHELLDAVRSVAADDAVRAVGVTGSGRAFSSGADLRDMAARPLTRRGPRRRLHDADDRLSPDPHDAAADAQAGRRGGQRPRRRHRLLARAGLRPDRLRRVGLHAAGLREHRPRARRRRARPSSPRARARDARPRWRCSASASRRPSCCAAGLVDEVVADDELDARVGARLDALAAGPDALLRGLQAPAQRVAVRRPGRAARARGAHPAGDGGLRRLPRGRHRVSREARAEVRRRDEPGEPGIASRSPRPGASGAQQIAAA